MRRSRSPVSLVLPTAATLAVVVATGVVLMPTDDISAVRPDRTVPTLTGVVADETGKPLRGATVVLDQVHVTTRSDGRFAVPHEGAAVLTASAPGHLPRTTAIEPGQPARITLTGRAGQTVSLRFGGDVMFGRRYYTGSENTKPVLDENASSGSIASVLAGVQPFLADADLSVVNLETALVESPWTHVEGKRPSWAHPDKDLVITSSTKVARALAIAGIDLVSLSNNHSFDGRDNGLSSTIEALDAAGVSHFGAGRTPDEAWRPAVVELKGQRIAFLGCTTVDGRNHEVSYVAEGTHGGAAACDPKRLEAAVRAAHREAPYVVVTIHGGVEYRRSQTAEVRTLADIARGAGARLVVGSHPHVVGGITHEGDSVFIESMGNLAFDQEIWSTLPSYLARVEVRAGVTVAADVDPLVLDGYRPRPVVGALARSISRMTAGWVDGGVHLDRAKATVPIGSPAGAATAPTVTATVQIGVDRVRRLAAGWWLVPSSDLVRRSRAGTDQLFGTGSFEADVLGTPNTAPLWTLGKYGRVTPDASCSAAGGRGLLLARTPLSRARAVATTRHRVPAHPGQALSLVAKVGYASAGSRLEVHWYRDFSGPGTSTSRLDIPAGAWGRGRCQTVRFDVVVPRKAVAAQVFVVLSPPQGGQTVRRLAVDDVMLVDWAPEGRSGRRYDVIGGLSAGDVTVGSDDKASAATTPLDP